MKNQENLLQKGVFGRQMEVLKLASEGLTDKEIASELGISRETVKTHWKRLRERYNSSSRVQIVNLGLEQLRDSEKDEDVPENLALLLLETSDRKRAESELMEANRKLTEAIKEKNHLIAELTYRKSSRTEEMQEKLKTLEHIAVISEQGPAVMSRGSMSDNWQKVYLSSVFDKLTQRSSQEMIDGSASPADFVRAEDLVVIVEEILAGVAKGEKYFVFDYHGIRQDGGQFPCREWITLQYNEDGIPTHYSTVLLPHSLLGGIEDSLTQFRKIYEENDESSLAR